MLEAEQTHGFVAEDRVRADGGDGSRGVVPAEAAESGKDLGHAALEFSNGHKISIQMRNTAAAQEFVFPNQLTAWVKLSELRETSPLGDNGVTEWEVYGKDSE